MVSTLVDWLRRKTENEVIATANQNEGKYQ